MNRPITIVTLVETGKVRRVGLFMEGNVWLAWGRRTGVREDRDIAHERPAWPVHTLAFPSILDSNGVGERLDARRR